MIDQQRNNGHVRNGTTSRPPGDPKVEPPARRPEPLTPPRLVTLTMLAAFAIAHLGAMEQVPMRVWGLLVLGLSVVFGLAWRPHLRAALRRVAQPYAYPYYQHPDRPAFPPSLVAATLYAPALMAQLLLEGLPLWEWALFVLLVGALFGWAWRIHYRLLLAQRRGARPHSRDDRAARS